MHNLRSMPQWVTREPTGRIGPKPPALPISDGHRDVPPKIPPKKPLADPDYEVIEFGASQLINAQKKPALIAVATGVPLKCALCGSLKPKYRCEMCKNQVLCSSCDDMYHRHPKRKNHMRMVIETQHAATNVRPPLPPKGGEAPSTPVPPPRRKQKAGFGCPSAQQAVPTVRLEAPPSPSLSLRERMSTLKRMIVPGHRSTPDYAALKAAAPPPIPARPPARPTNGQTFAANPFDAIQRPPSITMEKIKQQQCATLDRMSMLQQRYRESQLNLHAASTASGDDARSTIGRNGTRRVTSASQADLRLAPNAGRRASASEFAAVSHVETLSRMRAGSLAGDLNQRRPTTCVSHIGGAPADARSATLNARSTNGGAELHCHTAEHGNGLHRTVDACNFGIQPQSSNQLLAANNSTQHTCMSCSQQQLNWNMMAAQTPAQHRYPGSAWDMNAHQLNGSNMSLNIMPSAYYPQRPPSGRSDVPPAAWFNQGWMGPPNGMYMMPVPAGYHDRRSCVPSRSQSRAASPTMSIKSRKSTLSARQRPHSVLGNGLRRSFQLTNDEADTYSDEDYVDDYRSYGGRRNSSVSAVLRHRRRRPSTASSNDPDDSLAAAEPAATGNGSLRRRSSVRDRRSGSTLRSSLPKQSTGTSTTVPARVLPDSGSESGTKALVQAKIAEKIAVQSSMDESSSDFWKQAPKPVAAETEIIQETVPKRVNEPKQVEVNMVKQTVAKQTVEQKLPELPIEPKREITAESRVVYTNASIVEQITKSPVVPNITEKIVDEAIEENVVPPDECGPVGPPPSAPDFAWECEFCTFVNEPKIKICVVCCKTPVNRPTRQAIKATTLSSDKCEPGVDNESASTAGSEGLKGKAKKISFWPGTKVK